MTCDEVGIKLAAEKRGIRLEEVNFPTTVNILDGISQHSLVLDRCQSKSRRERVAFLVEEQGGHVINSFETEIICNSKIFTTARFAKHGVKAVKTAYVPFAVEKEGETPIYRADAVKKVVENIEGLFKYPFVAKPERGSRGRNIARIEGRSQLENLLKRWFRSLDSPAGLLIQECVNKAFDLRIVVSSCNREKNACLASLARVPVSKEFFATNTALGAIPVGVELPKKAEENAVKAAMAVSKATSVFGVDAIPEADNDRVEKVIAYVEKVVPIHNRVKKAKEKFSNSVRLPLEKFLKAREKMDEAFKEMINTSEYCRLKEALEEILEDSELYFIEVNSRPDFYINTRNCTGVDVSEAYIRCIEGRI
jgi:glutathione synthase/RimK-type ligase-like ATP-grasp enzyme